MLQNGFIKQKDMKRALTVTCLFLYIILLFNILIYLYIYLLIDFL